MKFYVYIVCYTLSLILTLFQITTDCAPIATVNTTAPATAGDSSKDDVQILKFDNDNIGVDGYNFYFETSDGVSRKESAKLKNVGTEDEAISVQGWVTWKGPDGVQYTLNYLADENGFQPEGAHLPVPPEV